MTHPHDERHEDRRHEDKGPEGREPESGAYRVVRKLGFNLNSLIMSVVLLVMSGSGVGVWKLGGGALDTLNAHSKSLDDVALGQREARKAQGEIAVKVDTMTSLFTQVLTSQGKLEAAQVTLAKSQDDLRVEIASLKASGTERKVQDLDERCRKQAEDIAELRAIFREKEKK